MWIEWIKPSGSLDVEASKLLEGDSATGAVGVRKRTLSGRCGTTMHHNESQCGQQKTKVPFFDWVLIEKGIKSGRQLNNAKHDSVIFKCPVGLPGSVCRGLSALSAWSICPALSVRVFLSQSFCLSLSAWSICPSLPFLPQSSLPCLLVVCSNRLCSSLVLSSCSGLSFEIKIGQRAQFVDSTM